MSLSMIEIAGLPILHRPIDRASFLPDEGYTQQMASLGYVLAKKRQPHELLHHRMMTLGLSHERHDPVQVYGIAPPMVIDTTASFLLSFDPQYYAYLGGGVCPLVSRGEIKVVMSETSIKWLLPPHALKLLDGVHHTIPYFSILVVMNNDEDRAALYMDKARVDIDTSPYSPGIYTFYVQGHIQRSSGGVFVIKTDVR